jgi:phospholipid-binding lipoprotein MlaA
MSAPLHEIARSPSAGPGRRLRRGAAAASVLLLAVLAAETRADGLFGPTDAEREARPWFGVSVEQLYEGVRGHFLRLVETSRAAIAPAEPAVTGRQVPESPTDRNRLPMAIAPSTAAGATTPVQLPNPLDPEALGYDPLEQWNRIMFNLNDSLRNRVFEPTADWYYRATSTPVQHSVRNFFLNLREPVTIVSNLVEGRLNLAGNATARFGINTVFGVLGLLDPATDMGFPAQPRNLEQTLCLAGLPAGPYLVLPILGPATLRDSVGRLATAVAYFTVMGPVVYVPYRLTDIALQYAEVRGRPNPLTALAADPYSAQKVLYLSRRALDCASQAIADQDLFTR